MTVMSPIMTSQQSQHKPLFWQRFKVDIITNHSSGQHNTAMVHNITNIDNTDLSPVQTLKP